MDLESLNQLKLKIELSVKDDRNLFDPVTGKFIAPPDAIKPMIMNQQMIEAVDSIGSGLDHFVLDENKNVIPATYSQWSMWYSIVYNRYMYRTYFANGVFLSTVALCSDHGFNFNKDPDYRPILFETLLMESDIDFCERYCTYQEAEAGHIRAVAYLRKEFDL